MGAWKSVDPAVAAAAAAPATAAEDDDEDDDASAAGKDDVRIASASSPSLGVAATFRLDAIFD